MTIEITYRVEIDGDPVRFGQCNYSTASFSEALRCYRSWTTAGPYSAEASLQEYRNGEFSHTLLNSVEELRQQAVRS